MLRSMVRFHLAPRKTAGQGLFLLDRFGGLGAALEGTSGHGGARAGHGGPSPQVKADERSIFGAALFVREAEGHREHRFATHAGLGTPRLVWHEAASPC